MHLHLSMLCDITQNLQRLGFVSGFKDEDGDVRLKDWTIMCLSQVLDLLLQLLSDGACKLSALQRQWTGRKREGRH